MRFRTEVSGPPIKKPLPPGWFFEQLLQNAKQFPDRVAFSVDHPDRREEYTYREVIEQMGRIAAGLSAAGIHPGDHAGILMENCPQWAFVLLGMLRLGVVAVPFSTVLADSSLRLLLEHSGTRLLFADGPNLEKSCRVAEPLGIRVVAVNGEDSIAVPWDQFARPSNPAPEFPAGNPDQTWLLIYTSGTTGDPKGAELTESNLAYEIDGIVEALQLSPGQRILSVLPFSHVLPLVANALGPLVIGAGVVFLPLITPQRITEAFHRHRISMFVCVPQFFYLLHRRIFSQAAAQPLPLRLVFGLLCRIARRLKSVRARRLLFGRIHKTIGADLKIFASGGSRFDPKVAKDLSLLGYTVLQAYGLTETSAGATATPPSDNRIGTVGKPIRGVTVRIREPNDQGVGEVLIGGPILMKGYYKDGARTAETIRDGWLYSGDLGCIDEAGNLCITGRSKDVIVLANGKNVYPEEVEAFYQQHCPYIKELCVIGIREESETNEGEQLHAIVVPDLDEFRRRSLTGIVELIRFEMEGISKQLPSYQRVHSLSIRNDPFPRTATRKLRRFQIQQEEVSRLNAKAAPCPAAPEADHPRMTEGVGAMIAEILRAEKKDAGRLDPAMNLELDLGLDSLARVELLGLLEARTGAHIDEKRASQIFTLGELLDELESAERTATAPGRNWKEILAPSGDGLAEHYALGSDWLAPFSYLVAFVIWMGVRVLFRLRLHGVEKLPQSAPYILAPNHDSFLDPILLTAGLPYRVISRMFSLGWADYFSGGLLGVLAKVFKIVPVDPATNLVRALQVGAAGLRSGRILQIYPEGSRSIDGHVAEFKKGTAILACELGVPVVPVGIRGTFEAWPRGGGFRLHPVEIEIGIPIDPKTFATAPDPYAAMNAHMRNAVKELTGE